EVRLAAYYFEKYSIGFVAGMLAHEFGVHPMASVRPEVHAEDAMLRDMPMPVPGLPPHRTMDASQARQSDHVLGAIRGNARYDVYRQAVVDMARVVLQQARASAGPTYRDVTDVLDSYFMDLASIGATNDNRLLGVPGRGGSTQVRQDIATVYNAYRQFMHDDPALSDLQPHLPPLKTEADVAADYKLLAGRVATGLIGGASVSKEMLPPPQRPATETAPPRTEAGHPATETAPEQPPRTSESAQDQDHTGAQDRTTRGGGKGKEPAATDHEGVQQPPHTRDESGDGLEAPHEEYGDALRHLAEAQHHLAEAERLDASGIGTSGDALLGRAHEAQQRLRAAENALAQAEMRRQIEQADTAHEPHATTADDSTAGGRQQTPPAVRPAADGEHLAGMDHELPPDVALFLRVRSLLSDVPGAPRVSADDVATWHQELADLGRTGGHRTTDQVAHDIVALARAEHTNSAVEFPRLPGAGMLDGWLKPAPAVMMSSGGIHFA
ncbi:hypothetical protein, partial [Streptomyces tremellae]|uniref:hypothetical protein n=1 Tax=Streptomyces tremellae TaxID=1124239 RepID=UPI003CD0BA93